ncbi:MAG: J domain-containing protein [Polyangiales bacterium]
MEPTAQGVLAKTPLAHLIVYCLERKLKGALILRPEGNDDNSAADVLTLVDGCPAKIRISDPIEHLGRVLLEIGAIDDAAYNESLMALGRGEGLVGQILVAHGKIDQATLEKGMRTQLVRKLGHLFSRGPGTRYAYYDGADFLARYGGPELFPVDPAPAIVASVRGNPSMAHADAAVEKMATTPLRIRPGADLSKLDLSRAEKEILSLLKLSPQTPQQLMQSGIADARTAKLLVYALILLKLVDAAPVAEGQQPLAMPKPEHPALGRQPSPVARIALQKQASPVRGIVEAGGGDGRDSPNVPENTGDPQRRAEILAKAKVIDSENYFQMLGLTSESTIDDAKTAYFQLAKRWHPDRLPGDLADLKDQVGKVFALMAEAYQILTDPDRRVKYMQQVKEGGGTLESQQEVVRVMDAANAFQKAEFFVNKGQLQDAEPHITKAFELEPGDTEHVALWCWVQANKAERRESGRFDDLLAKLDQALVESPRSERARFYRGMILKYAGRMGDAIRDFREVAEANPRHVDAVREVRLYTMRSERDRRNKDDGSGSLLGRFMKRK